VLLFSCYIIVFVLNVLKKSNMGNTTSNIPAHSPSERERMSPPQPSQPTAPPPPRQHSSSSTSGQRRRAATPTKPSTTATAEPENEKISAKEYKERGNKLYQAQRYDDAITSYTAAIMRDNTDPTYFTNRALCYLQTKKWDQAETDCRRALELDQKNIKANYFLGKICIQHGRHDEAIKALTRATEFASNQKASYGDDITNMLRQARRERFKIDEDKRINQEIELQSYLNRLIDQDIENNVKEILDKQNGDDIKSDEKIDELQTKGRKDKEMLNSIFAQVDDRRRRREIPDYLCGKISFELLKDPVITPSGITYDRSDIKEHLHRVGHFDPITRVPLTVEQLIPNLAMKEVLDTFITENEWALDV
jgi:STIP1 family protein 1